MWGPDLVRSWTILFFWISLNPWKLKRIKQIPEPTKQMWWVVFIGLCQLFSNHLSDRSDLRSPSRKQVTDLYSQKQHCKLNKSNISLIALFSHSVSLDWITFVDPAVCTGEFCHLPKVPCCSCQCLSLAPCSLSLPATNGWFWPLCAPSMCSSSHNWFCVFFSFFFLHPCLICIHISQRHTLYHTVISWAWKHFICSTTNCSTANLEEDFHCYQSSLIHLLWILLQCVPLKICFVWRDIDLHINLCPLLLYFLWLNFLILTGRVGCLKLRALCWEVPGGGGRSVP